MRSALSIPWKCTVLSIYGPVQITVFFKQFEAGIALKFIHIIPKFFASAENLVKLVIPETYQPIVLNRATIVNLIDIGPHTGT